MNFGERWKAEGQGEARMVKYRAHQNGTQFRFGSIVGELIELRATEPTNITERPRILNLYRGPPHSGKNSINERFTNDGLVLCTRGT